MTFDEYQQQALTTALYTDDEMTNLAISALGVAGEAGEVADKMKKVLAYDRGVMTEEIRAEFGKELGDVLWYVAVMAQQLGMPLDSIAQKNLDKLASRKERGVTRGNGDNR